jgi:hypothetical protein
MWAEQAQTSHLRTGQHRNYVEDNDGKPLLRDEVERRRQLADKSAALAEQARALAEMWARVASVLPPAPPVAQVTVNTDADPVALGQEIEGVLRRHGRGHQ